MRSGSSCGRFYKFEVAEHFFCFTGGLSGPLTLFFYNENIFFSLNVLCKDENVVVVVLIKNAVFSVYYSGGSFCSVLKDLSLEHFFQLYFEIIPSSLIYDG